MNSIVLQIGVGGFAAYLLVLCCLLRWLAPRSKALYVLAVSVAVFLIVVIPIAAVVTQPVSIWHLAAIYWFLSLIFIMGFGPAYKSVSLRVVYDLWEAPGRTLRRSDLTAQLVRSETFLHRVDLLERDGLITRDGDALALTVRGHGIAHKTAVVQKLFAVDHTG